MVGEGDYSAEEGGNETPGVVASAGNVSIDYWIWREDGGLGAGEGSTEEVVLRIAVLGRESKAAGT